MNGRIYDPLLGRMLSADLLVQEPGSLQSYNRYSYVRNNPLTLTDPSGWADDGNTNSGGLLDQLKAYVLVFIPTRSPVNPTSEYDTSQQQPQEQQQFQGAVRSANAEATRYIEGQQKVLDTMIGAVPPVKAGFDTTQLASGQNLIGQPASRTEAAVSLGANAGVSVFGKYLGAIAGKLVGAIVKDLGGETKPLINLGKEAVKDGLAPEIKSGSFSITEEGFKGYPSNPNVPKPEGPFRLLDGAEKSANRNAANTANRAAHRADPSLAGKQIHEIKPVKFDGSPTDPANKVPLPPQEHSQFTTWWKELQDALEKKR
jgi:hypothetical protein